MQPSYLPWMGYFDLIDQSDLFVFLDNVQFDNRSWQQRNRIKTSQGPRWLTVPVYQRSKQKILDVQIYNEVNWQRKHLMTMAHNYQKSDYWSEYEPLLQNTYQHEWRYLVDLNIHLIVMFCEILGIRCHFKRASQIREIEGQKSELLISICKCLNADVYLTPQGSRDYIQSDKKFKDSGITLKFHQYKHPTYPQLYGKFIHHLSLIDLLLNTGNDASYFIASGRIR